MTEILSISLIQKITLLTITLIIINLFLPSVTSFDIELNSPESAVINEEFSVSIKVNSSEPYDVKIFIHNSEDSKISRSEYISEIYNDGWKDSWFYIPESFPDQISYKIRAVSSSGIQKICARLRKSNTKEFDTVCNSIEIKEENIKFKEKTRYKKKKRYNQTMPKKIEKIKTISLPKQIPKETEQIVLTSQSKTVQKAPEILMTKKEKTRLGIVYAFTVFCIFIIILMAFRKL